MHFFSSSRGANSRHFPEDMHLTDPKRFFCARYLLCRARNYGNAAMIRCPVVKLMKAQTLSNYGGTLGESAHEFGEDRVEARGPFLCAGCHILRADIRARVAHNSCKPGEMP
jgi:hypothetical protein